MSADLREDLGMAELPPLPPRHELMAMLTKLVGEEMANKTAAGLTDEQLSDCIAEHELSQQFWDRWDADMKRDLGTDDIYVKE
jgi:hypothetical protein